MTQKAFNAVAGILFGLVAFLHALRLLFGWPAIIGSWAVPAWVSGAALVLAGWLTYSAFSPKR